MAQKINNKFVLVLSISLTMLGLGIVYAHHTDVHGSATDNISEKACTVSDTELATTDIAWIKWGSIDEDDSFRYRDHHYNPHTGDGKEAMFDTALETASERWQKMLAAFADPDNRWRGDELDFPFIQGSMHALGRVLHLLQDMSSPPHTHAPEGHGWLGLPGPGGSPGGYYSDFEETWSPGSTEYKGWSFPSVSGDPLTPDLAVEASIPGTKLDSESLSLMRGRINGIPLSERNEIEGYIKALAWISYFHTSFYGQMNWDETNPAPTTTSSGRTNILRTMFPGRISFTPGLYDEYWTIDGVGYYDKKLQYFEEDWWPCPGDYPYGSKTEGSGSSKRTLGRFYIYLHYYRVETSGGGTIGTFYTATPPDKWPDNTSNDGTSLARYYGDILLPLSVRFCAGLLQEAFPPPVSITYPSSSTTGQYAVSWGATPTSVAGSAGDYVLQRSGDGGNTWSNIYDGPGLSYDENISYGSYRYQVIASFGSGYSPRLYGAWRTGTDECIVSPAPSPDLSYYSHQIDDDASGGSNGNGDHVVNPGETIELIVTLQNTGPGDAHNVSAHLSTTDSYVTISDSDENYGDIYSGGIGECSADYDFTVSPTCPEGHVITFYLDPIQSDEGSWTDSFQINVEGSIQQPPSKPINPSPSYGATNQSTNVDISWSDGGGATSYDVYFGTGELIPKMGNQTSTSFDPGTLENGQTYNWIINAKNSGGTTAGDPWYFTTVAYTIATPTFLPDGGSHSTPVNVIISCATPGVTIHYTTNGVDPTESDPTVASGSTVLVNQSLTFKAKAWKPLWNFSEVKSANYIIGFSDIGAALLGVSNCSLSWGDYDNDGDLDLALAGYRGGSGTKVSKIYRNDGSGVFTDIDAGLTGVSMGSLSWGDYDNDGDLDLALAGDYVSKIYRNDGSGVFTDINAGFTEVWNCTLSWGDYDNDGDLDLARAGNDVSKIYRNDGSGVFTDIDAGLWGVWSCTLSWGDYDNDGDLDLVIAGFTFSGPPKSTIYRNDSSGVFTDIGAGLTRVWYCSLSWGDYDNDGDLDLALAGYDGNTYLSTIYRNDGSGVFTDIGAGLTGVRNCSLSWGDYDNDGDLDLALAGLAASGLVNKIYRNDGSGVFTDIGIALTGVLNCSLSWGDYDNDGDLDLAVAGEGVSKIYRNEGIVFNTAPTAPSGLSATSATGGVITFSWNAANDNETFVAGLSYNLRIGTSPGKDDVFSGMADPVTGLRRIVATGNAQKRLSWTLNGLQGGTYYWSVQSVDTTFSGSIWATEESFTLVDTYHPADPNCDYVISDFELLDYIDLWAQGQVGDFELLDKIDLWAAGHYYWDESEQKFKPGVEP